MIKNNKQGTLNGKITSIKRKKTDSEFQSYTYIKNELKKMGWNTKNPNRDREGQLFTQNECLHHPEIKSMLGRLTPEYVVKLREDTFWVIEAKPIWDELKKAYNEAIEYAELINKHQFVRAKIVSGIAGNDIDRYLVKSAFWDEEKQQFYPILYNNQDVTSLIKPEIANRLLDQNSPILKDYELDEEELLRNAGEINEVLHAGSIKKDKRATIVATVLLSLLGKTDPNWNDTPTVFVNDINNRAHEVLKANNKGDFFKYIQIQLPEKKDAQNKFKESLVSTFFLLKKVNIKSAMEAGSDILGKFYESFLKYGNGAKDLGIVLTPRHVTELVSEVLDITHRDVVYDPCCGTGGFLVSAFYHVKKSASEELLNKFKQHRIFGIDQQSSVASLAIINMIFRGDGKNNIINDDCLSRVLIPATFNGIASAKFVSKDEGLKQSLRPITKVLMNPPFSLKDEEERAHMFVQHALEQMDVGGVLFSVLPYSTMIKGGDFLKWRKNRLLKNNTLLSVITFPNDLFYPSSSVVTVGIFVKKGTPHPKNQNVLWIRAIHDGLYKKKGKRLPNPKIPNDLEKVKTILQSFVNNPFLTVKDIPEFQKAVAIDFTDNSFELVPEAYLDQRVLTQEEIEKEMDMLIRETAAFIIKSGNEGDFL